MSPSQLPLDIHCFEPSSEVAISYGHLPHWHQTGTICFITWRTWDSMPRNVLDRWIANRNDWLKSHHIDPRSKNGNEQLAKLPIPARREFRQFVSDRWNADLDAGHGSCPLAERDCAEIVARSLRHFDGDRYWLSDFVIMPNHVHLLAAFPDEQAMTRQCESWKHFTATCLNRLLGRTGRFWETESFDHLVRSDAQYDHLRRYIADNPKRAKLSENHYVLYHRGFARPK